MKTAIETTIPKCQYIGDGSGCNHSALNGRAYCEEHLWTVYQKGSARARRKKDERVAAQVWDIENAMNEAVQELIEEGFDL
jgi:hypothetical protein